VGQQVVGVQAAGAHTRTFGLSGMPRGTYIVKVSTDSYREAKPITVLK
jgi:hypothetical protein